MVSPEGEGMWVVVTSPVTASGLQGDNCLCYHTEVPFVWNAGLFVHAVREMELAARFETDPGRVRRG